MSGDRWYYGRLWHGMVFSAWIRLLRAGRFAISPTRVPMALGITLVSLANTALRAWQDLCWGGRVRRIPIAPDPVFIIGHWRTGTTMLHTLLALDPRHRCPSTYESLSPNHFLISEGLARRFLSFFIPPQRPMDNMPLGFDSPQEDEAALCLRGVPSPFAAVAFPNSPPAYPEYGDLQRLSRADLARWEEGLRTFLRLLLLRRSGRLVLKSPQHTFRLRTLTRIFPQACFVHLVRNPFEIFASTVHFWTVMYERYGLQRPDLPLLHERVFETLTAMYARLEQDRPLVDPSRFFELRYEDLIRDPVAAVEWLYRHFGWNEFPRDALVRYAAETAGFQPNRYDLPSALRSEIARRWSAYIKRYGYNGQTND
jgi:omega-hydroxy-beta-dihydromenaquinone-9 sulfotransferase